MEKKIVFFDFGGVLAEDILQEISKNLFPNDEGNRIYTESLLLGKCWKAFMKGKWSEDEYWKACYSIDPVHFEKELKIENEDQFVEFFSKETPKTFFVFEGVVKIAKKLKEKGIEIGILSNHSKEWFEDYFFKKIEPGIKLSEVFTKKNFLVLSYELGCGKPEKEIYEDLISKAKKGGIDELKNMVFIDNKKSNVQGAVDAGIVGIHFYVHEHKIEDLKKNIEKCLSIKL